MKIPAYMKARAVAVAVALALMPAGAMAEVSDYERFQLDNGCFPFQLVVGYSEKEAGSIDLSKERIETVVRSRLRAARLYEDPSERQTASLLYVYVHLVGAAYSYDLSFHKLMKEVMSISRMDSEGQHLYQPATWRHSGTGTHTRSPEYIVANVSEATDHFIDEFLRVNNDACGKAK